MNKQMIEISSDSFEESVSQTEGGPLHAISIETIQVNLGLLCNQTCRHCHVSAGPRRKEQMTRETLEAVLRAALRANCRFVDITGGAPEMNPYFRRFIDALAEVEIQAQVHTNLTILVEPGYEDMAQFMAQRKVWLVASLPCYQQENVDSQRGESVFERSIAALRLLNSLGYAVREDLPLDLVYNPLGPVLPPSQAKLEADYRRELGRRFGIRFSRLRTIANMPIGRFWADLRRQNADEAYQALLRDNFNPGTLPGLMCRRQISVRWDGTIHDCDFNLALNLPVNHGAPTHIRDFDPMILARRRIATGSHCFGCTAGCGSSCGGALLED
jgi:radical SAM/Cys-rich protein